MQGDDPPFLPVGTDVSAKYKGAFCEAKIKKVVRNIKCKVTFKATGIGSLTVTDDAIKGTLRVGNTVEVKHEQKKEMMEAIITKMQDCSQYTVVFDDGDITTLRRSALCLKSGRHFNESETLDQLPLTHPEHFSTPVIGHSAGRRRRGRAQSEESWSDGDDRGSGAAPTTGGGAEREPHAGRVVLVDCAGGGGGGRRAQTAFPGLVVAPTAQDTVKIKVKDEYLVRSFKDGRYYTVPKKEAREFKRGCAPPEWGGVEAALQFLNADTLPAHWDRDALFATDGSRLAPDEDTDDSSDDEPREEKDHFVAQLYKFMDDRGTPLNRNPTIANRDIDLYRLFRVVQKLGGCNRVTNQNQWKTIAAKMGFHSGTSTITNLCKQAYKKFLHSFEDFYRKLGVTLVAHPRGGRTPPSGRSLIRDRDRAPPTTAQPPAPPPQPAPAESAPVKEEKPASEPTTKISASRAAKEKEKEAEKPKEKEAPAKDKEKEKERESKSIKSEKISTSDEDSGDNQPLVTTVRTEKGETEKTPERSAKTVKNSKPSAGAESKRIGRKEASASHGAQRRSVKGRQTSREPPPVAVKAAESQPKAASEPSKRLSDRDKHSHEKETPSRKQASTDSDSSGRGSRCAVVSKSTPSRRSQSANSASSTNTVSSNSSKKPKKRKITGSQQSETNKGGSNTINAVVGDKLKVYYGPTHSESKVTYEAKVIEVSGRGADTLLRVHYTGWNTRYDEWIRPARIALNITHDQGKNKHKDKERMSTSSKRARAPPSANKPHTRNRTGSNATTASNSQHTDASVQSDTDSCSGSEQETSPPPQKRPAHDDKSCSAPNDACNEKTPTPNSSSKEPPVSPVLVKKELCPATPDKEMEGSKESPEKVLASSNKSVRLSRASAQLGNKRPATSEISPVRAKRSRVKVEEETPKGRDFDLNEIRSELKGLDIKNVIKSPVDNVKVEQQEMVIEKEEPIVVVKTEKTPEKVTEDIYEFKEPEPFEFEARKSEEKKKRIPTHRIFDDLPQLKLSPTRSPEKSSLSPTGNKHPTKSQYEEAFDKLCQSESYDNTDATEEPVEKEGEETLSLFDELAGEDSGDRLVISEAEDSQEPLFTYENELFPADKNLLPIFKAFTPAKNQETYSKKETTVKLPDIVDEFTNSPIKEDQSSDEDPIDAAIQRVNTLPPSSDDSIDGDLLIKSTTTTISLLKPYSPKSEVKPINPISETSAPIVTPEKILEIAKKEEKQETSETTVITAVKVNVSPTVRATSPTVKEEVVTIKIIEKDVPKSPQEVKESETISIKEVVPDTKFEIEVVTPASPPVPTHVELPVQAVTVKFETPPHLVKMKTDIEMSPLIPSNTIIDIMLSDNEDLKRQNKSDLECSAFVDVVIPEPPAGFLMHKEGPSIADKVLKAISSAKKAASLSPPFTSSKDNAKPNKPEGSKTTKTEISKFNKSDSLKLLPTTKIERVKSPNSSKTDNLKSLNKTEVPIKTITKLDPPVIGESVFGVEVPTASAELDCKLEVTVAKVETVTTAPLKMEVVERRKSGPDIPLPVIGKNNRVLSETIQKLSSQISQPPAIPVASFQPEDTSDSDDSDQRLIIDKLSEDESQSGASSSEMAGKRPAAWGTREETARQAEEDSNISLLLCEETIPGSPAPAEREAKQVQGKPKSARSLQMPFASAPSNSPEQVAGKQAVAGKAGGEGVWEGLHELVPERHGVLDNTPPTTPDTSLDNMSPHRDNLLSDGEGLDSKVCDEDIRNPGTSKKMLSDMDKSSNVGGRSRKASESSCAGGRRGRRPRRHSDSEDADSTHATLLQPSHHQRPLKYNFYVDLDPSWDCNARITLITSQLGELRKAYHGLKAELAAIDRRRKKLRRKEREAVKAAKAACS